MKPLNPQEQAALEFIAQYERNKGYAPNVREIAAAVGVKSTSVAVAILDELEARVYIARTPGKKRGIKVLRVPNYCRCPTCGALMEATPFPHP